MPKAAPKPCTQPLCKSYAVKDGRCEQHQRKAWSSNQGKSSAERGYGSKWRKIRERILKRDHYLCQECKRNGITTRATQVDHIINKANGGTDEDSNLQSLCYPCHKAKTIEERQ